MQISMLEIQMTPLFPQITGESISRLIDDEFSGDAAYALKSAVKCAHSVPGFLAERLYKALEGLHVNHDTLRRIVVSRSEVKFSNGWKMFDHC